MLRNQNGPPGEDEVSGADSMTDVPTPRNRRNASSPRFPAASAPVIAVIAIAGEAQG
jgi:hypothetical protein